MRSLHALIAPLLLTPLAARAETVVLYGNDFEMPNIEMMVGCGNSLDQRTINELFGQTSFQFAQTNTVEGLFIDDPDGLYSNPQGLGGNYAIGMLSTAEDDRLSMTFDSQGYPYINVGFHLSAIDISGCGGPFGVDTPIIDLRLLDSPGATFAWSNAVLAQEVLTGVVPADQWTFNWARRVATLATTGSTDGNISVVFDLTQSGYAALDNLTITASSEPGVVDTDLDDVPDDADNCVNDSNAGQENLDEDLSGDACDPAPSDPLVCGDLDDSGEDDCASSGAAGAAGAGGAAGEGGAAGSLGIAGESGDSTSAGGGSSLGSGGNSNTPSGGGNASGGVTGDPSGSDSGGSSATGGSADPVGQRRTRDDGDCGCRVVGNTRRDGPALLLLGLLLGLTRRQR